jgi:hypothetical protein
MEVQLRVQDPSASVKKDVSIELRDGAVVGDLAEALVKLFEWPRRTASGEAITHQVSRENSPAPIDPKATVASLGLQRGDLLILGPVLSPSR